MVDSTKKAVTEQIDTTVPTGLGKDLDADLMFQTTITNFREMSQAIINDLALNPTDVKNAEVNARLAKDAIDSLLQQLRTAIDEQNKKKTEEIMEIKEEEQSLEQIMKSSKAKSMQHYTSLVEQLRFEIT
jgi:polyhydroxyalkanoate synthesis regulator phasin